MAVGEYEAVIDSGGRSQSCHFTVARYRLAALVAELDAYRMLESSDTNVERTEVSMTLKTYGVPLTGRVQCDLLEKGRVLISKTIDVELGSVTVEFPFQGSGALSVNVQAIDDPSKTATLILQGSSKQDRDEVTFSRFSMQYVGSMAATENSKEIRGIHFVQKAQVLSPVQIEPTNKGIRIHVASGFQ